MRVSKCCLVPGDGAGLLGVTLEPAKTKVIRSELQHPLKARGAVIDATAKAQGRRTERGNKALPPGSFPGNAMVVDPSSPAASWSKCEKPKALA
jgi:hypothetical protein